MALEAPQGGAESAPPAVGRRVQELAYVKAFTALAGRGRADGGALAAAHAELVVTDDLAAQSAAAGEGRLGQELEHLVATMGERHRQDLASGGRAPIVRSISRTAATNFGGSGAARTRRGRWR